jgi:hypothetical protein
MQDDGPGAKVKEAQIMKNGFRIYYTDTHIDPGADVLEKYVDPGFRPRLNDLAPYRVAIKSRSVDGGIRHTYRFGHKAYERTLGEAEPRPGSIDGRVWRGERRPSPGVVDDRSDNRVLDMNAEGSDVHFPRPLGVDERHRAARRLARSRTDPRLPSPHAGVLCAVPGPAQGLDRRLDARRRRGGSGNPGMGNIEVGSRGAALARQRPSG